MSYVKELIHDRKYEVQPGTAFVIMPFLPVYLDVYEAIKIGLRRLDPPIFVHRVDELSVCEPIFEDVVSQIMCADFVIADLTGLNPNVFYELGLSHSVKNDVILITQSLKSAPFDVRSLRLIEYTHSPQGLQSLGTRLRKCIREARLRRQFDTRLDLLKEVSRTCARQVQNRFEIFINVMNGIAKWDDVRTNETNKHMQVLPKIQSMLPALTGGIYNLNESGTVVSSMPIDIVGQNYMHREYFRLCSSTLRPVVSNSFDSANRPCRIVVIAVPRYDVNGRFIGILDGVLDICDVTFVDIIHDVLFGLGIAFRPQIIILDESSEVIASSCQDVLRANLGGSALVGKLKEAIGFAQEEASGRIGDELGAMCRIKKTPFVVLTATNVSNGRKSE